MIFVLTVSVARCENTTNEFWPEVGAFFTVAENMRIVVTAKRERDVDFVNNEVGADLEISVRRFRPLLFGHLVEQDATRAKRITVRAGYRYKRSLNTGLPVNEHRPTAEFTLRWVFPEGFLMSNRSRGELRFVNGAFSWRYRDLLKFDRELRVGHYDLTAYASTEVFFDSRTSRWDRFRFTGGMVFPLGKHMAVEPYYTRQVAPYARPRNINAVGLVVQFYLLN